MMTALDEMNAAIDRLTALRDASTPGPFEAVNACDVFTEDRINDHLVANFSSGRTEVPYEEEAANRRLFLTLHGLIDPLLAVLAAGRTATSAFPDVKDDAGLPGWAAEAKALALPIARAINQNGEQA